jgi:hypothetical protein
MTMQTRSLGVAELQADIDLNRERFISLDLAE